MRYWFLMTLALAGGALLVERSVATVLPPFRRVELILGVVVLGMGRRMLQQRLHR